MTALTRSMRTGHVAHSQGDAATVTCHILKLRLNMYLYIKVKNICNPRQVGERISEEAHPSQRCQKSKRLRHSRVAISYTNDPAARNEDDRYLKPSCSQERAAACGA